MEPNTTPQNGIHERVVKAIASGTVTMHSRSRFVIKTVVIIFATVGALLSSMTIVNFILFAIHVQYHHELLGFGMPGIVMFFGLFPWGLLFVDFVLILLIAYLLHSFRIGYKTPLFYLAGILAALIIPVGALIERVGEPLNVGVLRQIDDERMPRPLMPLFHGIRTSERSNQPLCKCEIVEFSNTGLLYAKDIRNGRMFVFRLPQDSSYATTTDIVPGDVVIIAGTHDGDGDNDDVISAIGLRRMEHHERMMR